MRDPFMQCLVGMDAFNICREVDRGLMPEKVIRFEFENPLKGWRDDLENPEISCVSFSVSLDAATRLAERMAQVVVELKVEEERLMAAGLLKPYPAASSEAPEEKAEQQPEDKPWSPSSPTEMLP